MSSNNTTTTAAPQGQQQINILALPVALKIALYVLYCSIFLIGTCGNALVIYVIGIKHKVERSCDVHIVSLAVADLLSAIFIPLVMIHDTVTDYTEWHLLGEFGCKFFVPMNHLTAIVSALMLVTISLTRIHAIYSSITVSRRIMRSVVEVTMVWMVAIAITSPYMYHMTLIQHTICFDLWDDEKKFIYFTAVQTISCFLAIIIMVVVYSLSAFRLFRNSIPGDNQAGEMRRIKQTQRVTRMFGRIVLIFFTLTTPYAICFFIVAYYGTYDLNTYFDNEELFFYVTQLLYAFAAINCCVNPFIYAKMHRNMRRTLSKQFTLSFRFWSTVRKNEEDLSIKKKRNETIRSTLRLTYKEKKLSQSITISLSPISSRRPSPCVVQNENAYAT